MFWTGVGLVAFGALLFFVGWQLNQHTPVQQPLPVVGVVFALIGLGLVLWFH